MRSFFLALVLATTACAPSIPLEGANCPCVSGWTCCPGIQVCAASLDRCDAIPGPIVTPAEAELGVGRRLQFTATGENVTWEVEDSLIAGSVDANGLYFAPPSPGVFHLVARSSFGARRVQITVRDLRLSPLAGDYGGPSDFPVDGIGGAARVSSPRNAVMSSGALWFVDAFETLVSPFSGTLRRFDPVTRQTTTLFVCDSPEAPERDGAFGVGSIGQLMWITSGGPHSILIRDARSIRELDTDTLALTTVRSFGPNDPSVLQSADELLLVGDTLFGVDTRNNRIVKWVRGAPTDEVLAGSGMFGFQDGQGTAATFSYPRSLAWDGANLFVIDANGETIRRITTGGLVTTAAEYASVHTAGYLSLNGIPPEFVQRSIASPNQLLVTTVEGYVGINANVGIGRLYANSMVMDSPRTALATTFDAIRRFDVRAGIPEVVAGRAGASRGRDDGQGADARFVFNSGRFTIRGDTAWFCEEATGRIRTVTRAGVVSTPFETTFENGCGSLAVDDQYVYAISRELMGGFSMHRAPRFGGTWESKEAPFDGPQFLGVLNDGRIVVSSSTSVGFLDPVTFKKLPMFVPTPGAFAIDPAGALYARSQNGQVSRMDLATNTWTDIGPPMDPFIAPYLNYANGKIYAVGMSQRSDGAVPVIFELDPAAGAWAPLVGKLRTGAVVPGPLPTALLHEPGWVAAFDNGDLLVSDRAENVFLVIE
ncbi:MAG: hypothetical protein QM817_04955 [Archangium sp.]